ncbi:hypothetical protein Y032_0059g3007 [Ancylostoma ceylanicum]|uniref:Uncharacterized protein n=1 Tax=Ancylostoma ceylanicum TaxID=53326 RepID=A0A016U336_9BILA|nr:hypothetical protein Y032_0059g3007 [Ancylostoma ceylanicum]
MCVILKHLYRLIDIILPPRIPLRYEPYRVKNMLPSYGLIPDEVSDSEEDAPHLVDSAGDREVGGGVDESREMESTIRVHLKDDQADGGTVENVSVLVKNRGRGKRVDVTQASEKRKRPILREKPVSDVTGSGEMKALRKTVKTVEVDPPMRDMINKEAVKL